jgi:hypothetical protein
MTDRELAASAKGKGVTDGTYPKENSKSWGPDEKYPMNGAHGFAVRAFPMGYVSSVPRISRGWERLPAPDVIAAGNYPDGITGKWVEAGRSKTKNWLSVERATADGKA